MIKLALVPANNLISLIRKTLRYIVFLYLIWNADWLSWKIRTVASCAFVAAFYLAALKLTLKGNEQIFPIAENRADKHGRGLDFVGFVFYHNQTLMRKSIKQNFCRMAARLNKKLNISARDYKQKLCSWYGWAKVSNSKHLLKTIIKSQFYDTFVLRCKAV